MNYPSPILRNADGSTTAFPAAGPRSTRRPPRCRVAMSIAGGSAFRGAIESLLHHRLLFVAVLTLIPSLIFLIRNRIDTNIPRPLSGFGLLFHGSVALVTAGLAWLLWRRKQLSLRVLRAIELALFGSLAVFFAWLQYKDFLHGPLQEASRCAQAPLILSQAVGKSSNRWFFLIVLYGVFIPNTWRRCLLVSLGWALTPLILTPLAASRHAPLQAELFFSLLDMATFLAVAIAIAVFGSYRIQILEEQAFEAQQLGQYRLKKRLGAGGMGEVYLAEHLLLRRPCAVKLIRPEQAGEPTNLQRFEREVQAMATLTHANTVEIYDYGHADDGTFYYVMEYLPGQNLENLVAIYGPLPPGRAIHLLRQVCRALREAHGVGLLHRDIKPSNIIACERGAVFDVVKLLDFGLVQESRFGKEDDRLTQLGTIIGSPPYMSPEQAAGKSGLDPRSDIYSLGAVAYYLLTGQPPFIRETAMMMLMAHAYEPVIPLTKVRPEVPLDLQAVVLRCLEKDPAHRFPDAHSLELALAACESAEQWTEERAALWWHEHPILTAGDREPRPDVPTQITV
ncbi:MAG TPA: serine/threonine-protein kinase [Gemmataceae bacterium]|nr:serine/threonine-protein kinase [Gemmataceae bacterium]